MTTPREAAQQALELRRLADKFSEGWHDGIKIDATDVMLLAEVAAALEQPEQEPLFVVEGGELRPLRPALLNDGDKLYTHPPRRETEPAAFGALVAISLLTHLGGEVADYEDVVEAVRRLHALNGELLEALKQMLEVWEEDPAYGAKHADKARAAVIRARGQA
jgi:hypothetical protein